MHEVEELLGVLPHRCLEHQADRRRALPVRGQLEQGLHKRLVQPSVTDVLVIVGINVILIGIIGIISFIGIIFVGFLFVRKAEKPWAGEEGCAEERELRVLVLPLAEEGVGGELLPSRVLPVDLHDEGGALLVGDVEVGAVQKGDDLPPVEGGVDALERLGDDARVPLAGPVWLGFLRPMVKEGRGE